MIRTNSFLQLRDDITVKMQEIDKETRRKTKLEKERNHLQVHVHTSITLLSSIHAHAFILSSVAESYI